MLIDSDGLLVEGKECTTDCVRQLSMAYSMVEALMMVIAKQRLWRNENPILSGI